MATKELEIKLKEQLIEYLNLIDVTPDDIDNDAPLFGPESNVNLDSIDAIEISVLLDREYGIKITDPKKGRKAMASINTLLALIEENGKG